jgi:hypothetical protein
MDIKIMNIKTKSMLTALASALVVLLIFGIPTALIPIGVYIRMIEVTILDYLFLLASSALVGTYVGFWSYSRWKGSQGTGAAALGGGAASFFAVSCPVCNVLLVSLIGTTSIMVFLEPLRPILGLVGLIMLGLAVYYKYREFKGCRKCK